MSDYFDRVERQLMQSVERRGVSRWRPQLDYLALVAAVAVVVAVVGVILAVRTPESHAPAAAPGHRIVLRALPLERGEAMPPALAAAAREVRERLLTVDRRVTVRVVSGGIVIMSPHPLSSSALALAIARGELRLYDWEGNVLLKSGQTVAAGLRTHNGSAFAISQGTGFDAPGSVGAGCLPLHRAIGLARRHPGSAVFGATNGPGYYVLEDHPALTSVDYKQVTASTYPETGTPGLKVNLNHSGETHFGLLTSRLARRGAKLSTFGDTLNQHLAIAVDGQLLSVVSIDFQTYPDGVLHDPALEILPSLGPQAVRELAAVLRYGPLPVRLSLR
jgi:hypothetical protein